MDKLTCMSIFAQVADAGNFSKVAIEQGLSNSAVSKYVATLERDLGVQLLNRTTRKLSLTEGGADYLLHCKYVLEYLADADRGVANRNIEPRGTLKINAPMSFGLLHLGDVIADFSKHYPDVEIDLELSDNYVDVVEEGFDLGIRIGELRDSSLISRRLAPIRRLCCAAPAYLEAHGAPLHPDDLADHKCIHYGHRGWLEKWQMIGPDGEHSIAAMVPLKSNNGDVMKAAAVAGAGLVHMPTFITWRDVAAGNLVRVLPDYAAPEIGVYVVYPSNRHLPTKVRLFIDALAARYGPEPYWDAPEIWNESQ